MAVQNPKRLSAFQVLKLCKKKVARSRKKDGLEMNIQTTGLTIRKNVPSDGNCLIKASEDKTNQAH